MHDSNIRSFTKAVTWRILATSATVILVLLATGEFVLALGVGGAELILKTLLFFLHERAWDRVRWGKVSEA